MVRLTAKIKRPDKEDLIVYTKGTYEDTIPAEMTKNDIRAILKKLAAYEDAEEQGRILRLPCKVGDKVYQISKNFIEPCTVEAIFLGNYKDRNGNWCNMAEIYYDRDDCPYVSTEMYFTDIGGTVFLTETEAEAKLKEMEGGHGE